ncbi:hypothetical protein QJS10_CPB20g01178 [Acorus calamus]|uniref:Pm52 protein n=1 Tax=Acorus calamus TaxID=4465 RepID=A0AAV9C971_ACOCL|nr:hypothetical protein QJS10_CPB20g01178 [Acorus calamus]
MVQFNVLQKQRRAAISDRKRDIHGDPNTRKLKVQTKTPVSVSGKRKRKLFKKWRREQKEALEKGLVTMEDIEMAVAEGSAQEASNKTRTKFNMKNSRLKIKKLKGKGKSKRKSKKPAGEAQIDAMIE